MLNSDDDAAFGGTGTVHNKAVRTHKKPLHGFEQSITVTLPPMSTLYFEVPGYTRKPVRRQKAAEAAEKAAKKPARKTAAKAKAEEGRRYRTRPRQ